MMYPERRLDQWENDSSWHGLCGVAGLRAKEMGGQGLYTTHIPF